jgi:hypothetical protein
MTVILSVSSIIQHCISNVYLKYLDMGSQPLSITGTEDGDMNNK